MKATVKERLMEFLEFEKIPKTTFSMSIADSKTYVNAISQSIQPDKLLRISKLYPRLNIEWLMVGRGEMIRTENSEEQDTRPRIPTSVAAGSLMGFADAIQAHDCEMQPVIRNLPAYDYTIIIKGDSMEPKFEGGDEIAIKKVTSFVEWGKTYVLDTRDGAVIKRIFDDGDSFRCVSFNKEYPDFNVPKDDVFGVYKVVGLIRI